ncbi:serine acetyltransferase [Candidatus Parcubacteria bacterium]|nr:serine acetyltransferase [Candidatus Parcubacteria bacterium]
MINSKEDYKYYLEADRIANALPKKSGIKSALKDFFLPNHVWEFQKTLRKLEYYKNCKKGKISLIQKFITYKRFKRLSLKLGFTIPTNTIGPGLSIAHYGTIIINEGTKIGSNCRLHTCVNIGTEAGYKDRAPIIGDNCYIGPGVKMYGDISIANGIAIGANSVVNKSFDEENIAIAGIPAQKISSVDTSNLLIPATEILKNK